MNRYDLIAFDMDGTLLDSGKHFLQSSRDAVQEAAQAGKTVCISTGRCMPEMTVLLQEVPAIRYVIGSSGAFIFDCQAQTYIYREEIPAELAETMLRRVRGLDCQIVIMSDKAYSQRDKVSHMADYNMGAYQPGYERDFQQPEDITAFFLAAPFPVFKMNFYCRNYADRELIAGRFAELPLDLIYAEGTSLEATLKGVTKGAGFRRLYEALGIDRKCTIAVGDADNDLSALAEAGLGIAMGNANEHVLAAADVVVADNDSGGCAEAIRTYMLGSPA